jgi:hypothetical protein
MTDPKSQDPLGAEPEDEGGIGAFFREYWPWIVGPIAFALVLALIAMFLIGGGEGSEFTYKIW